MYIFTCVLVFLVIKICLYFIDYRKYVNSDYYKCSHVPFYKLRRMEKGSKGEYLIYKKLSSLCKEGARFLFNVYVPIDNGYTEIDCIMLHRKGIFVFESKNYSGWIFGDDSSRQWTQSLYSKRSGVIKEKFLNPVWQNKLHISALDNYLDGLYNFYSVICFSNRCTFKSVSVNLSNTFVIRRDSVLSTVNSVSSKDEISNDCIAVLFDKLFPLTQVSDEIKRQHVDRIKKS